MTGKQYGEEQIKIINNQLNRVNEELEQKSKVYSISGAVCGVLALCALANLPAAIAFGGLSSLFFLSKHFSDKTLGSTKSRLENEKNHVAKVLKTGVNNQTEVQKKRKGIIDKLKPTYSNQEEKYLDSSNKLMAASRIATITTLAACIFPSTLLAAAALGTVGLKYLAGNDVISKKQALEDTARQLNNYTNDYNIGFYSSFNQRNSSVSPQKGRGKTTGKIISIDAIRKSSNKSNGKNAMPFHVGGYSREDEEKVDAYIRSLEKQGKTERTPEKRKV